MRRCHQNGLRRDEQGRIDDPCLVRRRLRTLARWTGNPRVDIGFAPSFARVYSDVGTIEGRRIWNHAYLGRYMGLGVNVIERMPTKLVRAYVDAVSSIIKRENTPAPATTGFTL